MTAGTRAVLRAVFDGAALFFVWYLAGYTLLLLLRAARGSRVPRGRRDPEPKEWPAVSVIVPVFNGEETILETLSSLLKLRYPNFEIVVVDDGSTDGTVRRVWEHFALASVGKGRFSGPLPASPISGAFRGEIQGVRLTLLRKAHGGTEDALNVGVNAVRNPYFLCCGADAAFEEDALAEIVRPVLADPTTAAVGGAVTVQKERGSFLAEMQAGEYERAFLAPSLFFARFGGTIFVSRAFGLFRRETVLLAGGFHANASGEDLGLILRMRAVLRERGERCILRYAPKAVCRVRVPQTLSALCAQRGRRYADLVRTVWTYRRTLLGTAGIGAVFPFLCCAVWGMLFPFEGAIGFAACLLAAVRAFRIGTSGLAALLCGLGFTAVTCAAYSQNAAARGKPASLRGLVSAAGFALLEIFAEKPIVWAAQIWELLRAALQKLRICRRTGKGRGA